MKKVLSVLFALAFVLSSCVVFAAGVEKEAITSGTASRRSVLWTGLKPPPAVKGSEKEVIIELGSSGFDWSYTVDNEEVVKLVSYERIPFMGAWGGIMPPPTTNRWHFEPIKEGDVTITFTSPVHWQDWKHEFAKSKKISYTYHIDGDLNMELVSEGSVTLPLSWQSV